MTNLLGKVFALWSKEQIRVLVMVSLAMQLVLIFFASHRKRSGNKLLPLLLWPAYLGADYIATLALGTILAHVMDTILGPLGGQSNVGLPAFWAPFLLIHLGGPDNITSYSIEDNELWWRHCFSFVAQVSTALMVLVLSPLQSPELLVASILTFIVGTMKFGERTLALRAATMERLRQSIQKRQSITNEEFDALRSLRDDSDAGSIVRSYVSFLSLRAHMIGTTGWNKFHVSCHDGVFEEIGMELSFFYDILHTKATVVHCVAGRAVRLASLVSISIALLLFHFHIREKHRGHDSNDVIITYILLSVALFLEMYSVLLLLASKWTIISLLRASVKTEWCRKLAKFISRAKKYVFECGNKQKRWWSGHMGQYSVIQSCSSVRDLHIQGQVRYEILNTFKEVLRWDLLHSFGFGGKQSAEVSGVLMKMMINHIHNLERNIPMEADVWRHFKNLTMGLKSSWITKTLDLYDLGERDVDMWRYFREASFERCVVVWHMTTEMWYFALGNTEEDRDTEQRGIYRVSNYMMHLLLERPSMMPPGIGKVTVEDTWAHIDDIMENVKSLPTDAGRDMRQVSKYMEELLSKRPTGLRRIFQQKRFPQSVWLLLHQVWSGLSELEDTRKWEVIRDGWMEMLSFAALQCSPTEHAKGLSRGGELITHYWLLLAHNRILEDFDYQFRVESDHSEEVAAEIEESL